MVKIILATFPNKESAEKLSRKLVAEQKIACANILGECKSIYKWKGKIEEEKEVIVLFKTASDRVDEVLDAISSSHTYEVPEALVLNVTAGLDKYMAWVYESTGFSE